MSNFLKLTNGKPRQTLVLGTDLGSGAALGTQFLASDGVGGSNYRNLVFTDIPTTFAYLPGRLGGQTLNGDTDVSGSLTLSSTSNAAKGTILFGTSIYDELNNRLGIGMTPANALDVNGNLAATGSATFGSLSVTSAVTLSGLTVTGPGTPDSAIIVKIGTNTTSGTINGALRVDQQITNDANGTSTGARIDFIRNFTAAPNAGTTYGLYISSRMGATNTQNWTSSESLTGVGVSFSTSSGAAGTMAGAFGFSSLYTHNATNVLTTQAAYRAYSPAVNTGTITNAIGFWGSAISGTTNRIGMLLGTSTIPSGNFGIYSASTDNNYLNGILGVGIEPVGTSSILTNKAAVNLASDWNAIQALLTRSDTSTSLRTMFGFFSDFAVGGGHTAAMTSTLAGMGAYRSRLTMNSGSAGSIDNLVGFHHSITGGGTTSVTNHRAIQLLDPTNVGTLTSNAGLVIEAQTKGTNNTAILLGTPTIPTGNFAIYSTSTNDSRLFGQVQVDTVPALYGFNLTNAGVKRWTIRTVNTEAGADSGSDLNIFGHNDAGTGSASAITITRSTGAVTIGTLGVTGTATLSGSNVFGGAAVLEQVIAGDVTRGRQLRIGNTGTGYNTVGSRFSNSGVFMASNAGQVTDNSDNWTQPAAAQGSMRLTSHFATGLQLNVAAAGTANGNNATFWGTAVFSVSNAGAVSMSSTLAVTGTSALTGLVGIGSAFDARASLYLNTQATTAGVSQYALLAGPQFSATATTGISVIRSTPSTIAAAFTVTALKHLEINDTAKGAGSAITTQYGVYIDALAAGGTNYGIYSAGSANLNYFAGFIGAGTTVTPARIFDAARTADDTNTSVSLQNSSAGTNNQIRYRLDNGTALGVLEQNGTGIVTSAFNIANALTLRNDGTGGINVVASNAAGPIRFYAGGSTEVARFDSTGNMGIGSAAAVAGRILRLNKTYTDVAAASAIMAGVWSNVIRAETVAPSAQAFLGVGGNPQIAAANTQNLTSTSALVGLYSTPQVITGATGVITGVRGVISEFVHNGSGAVTIYRGFHQTDPTGTGTIDSVVGVSIDAMTKGTNNTSLLLGTATVPTGNWGIYNTSTNDNFLSGSVGIGAVPVASIKLEIRTDQNAATIARIKNNTSGTTANANFAFNSVSSSGQLGAYDSAFTSIAAFADRVVLSTNSDASGITLYSGSAGTDIRFYSGSGTISGLFDSSGQFLVGTSAVVTSRIAVHNAAANFNGRFSGNTGAYTFWGVGSVEGTNNFGYIGDGASVVTGGAATDFGIRANSGHLLFATNGATERMRIKDTGEVGIGTAAVVDVSVLVGGTRTNSANTQAGYEVDNIRVDTAGASVTSMYGVFSAVSVGAANTQNLTSATAMIGGLFFPRTTTGATGTITGIMGVQTRFTHNAATVSAYHGVHIQDATGTGTITSNAGLVVAGLTKGTNNVHILIGTTTIPAGNFSIYSTSANEAFFSSNITLNTIGNGFKIKEGTNARMGVATLTAGTVTVANTSVTATSRIFLTAQSDGGTVGFQRVSARAAGTSFTITSSSGADTSVVAWMIIEPA